MWSAMIQPVADIAAFGWKSWQLVAHTSSTSRRIRITDIGLVLVPGMKIAPLFEPSNQL